MKTAEEIVSQIHSTIVDKRKQLQEFGETLLGHQIVGSIQSLENLVEWIEDDEKYEYLAEHGSPEEIAEAFHDLLEIAEELQEKIGKQKDKIRWLRGKLSRYATVTIS